VQADRERLTQLFFEQFNVTSLFLCDQAVLSLYALGKTSGTVIDLGYDKVGEDPVGSAKRALYISLPPPTQHTDSSALELCAPERPSCSRAGVPCLVTMSRSGSTHELLYSLKAVPQTVSSGSVALLLAAPGLQLIGV
jgi:hypothetical protein